MKLLAARWRRLSRAASSPVPGGPYSNTPVAGWSATRSNASAYSSGHWTVSRELLGRLRQSADVAPGGIRHFHEHFPERRGVVPRSAASKSASCVHSCQHRVVRIRLVRMHVVPTEGVQRRFANQLFEIRADEPVRAFGERFDISTSSVRGVPRVRIRRISRGRPLSGTPISTSRSNRPGRRSAGSSVSGWVVVPTTTSRLSAPRSSISETSGPTPSAEVPGITPRPGDRVELVDEDDHGFVCSGVLEPVSTRSSVLSRCVELSAGPLTV